MRHDAGRRPGVRLLAAPTAADSHRPSTPALSRQCLTRWDAGVNGAAPFG